MFDFIRKTFITVFVLIFVWTLVLLIGFAKVMKVITSKSFPLENIYFFLAAIFIVALLFVVNNKFGIQCEALLNKYKHILLLLSLTLLFLWQVYSSYGGYFHTGWDAGVIRNTVYWQLKKDYDQLNNDYFSWFPNNRLLVWIFTAVAEAASLVGYKNWEMALVVFQCMIGTFAVFLVYDVTEKIVQSQRMAFAAFFIALLFVGFSPWYIVAYSDATGIFFPILIVRLWQLRNDLEKITPKFILGILIGFMSITGFYIKPQIFISFIAIVLWDSIKNICNKLYSKILWQFLSFAIGILFFVLVYNLQIIPSLHFQSNAETTIGWQHYFMMGMNAETDGIYNADDYSFTYSISNNQDRNRLDYEEAVVRIRLMGVKGLFTHLSRKQLVNYGDGTFSWNVEGGFFEDFPDWAKNGASNFMKSFIVPEGEYYNIFISIKQFMWIMILLFMPFTFIYGHNGKNALLYNRDDTALVIGIAIIGLTVFELLFEARARYLFTYAPLFVVLSTMGMKNAYCYLAGKGLFKKL